MIRDPLTTVAFRAGDLSWKLTDKYFHSCVESIEVQKCNIVNFIGPISSETVQFKTSGLTIKEKIYNGVTAAIWRCTRIRDIFIGISTPV